jgi:hypothetical protein
LSLLRSEISLDGEPHIRVFLLNRLHQRPPNPLTAICGVHFDHFDGRLAVKVGHVNRSYDLPGVGSALRYCGKSKIVLVPSNGVAPNIDNVERLLSFRDTPQQPVERPRGSRPQPCTCEATDDRACGSAYSGFLPGYRTTGGPDTCTSDGGQYPTVDQSLFQTRYIRSPAWLTCAGPKLTLYHETLSCTFRNLRQVHTWIGIHERLGVMGGHEHFAIGP